MKAQTRADRRQWEQYQAAAAAFPEAAEAGRSLAASIIANDQAKRKEMEEIFGLEEMQARYPEAYKGGFSKLVDRIRQNIPW